MKNSRRQALPVLATLNALNKKYGKLYCYPAQLTIMALLGLYHDTNIAIATLNRWLRDLEDKGYIIRVRRIRRDKKLGTVFQSTLYKITILGYQALKATGVDVWRELKELMTQGIKAGNRALSKFSGPVSLKTILAAPMMFGVGQKTWITEKG